MSLTSDAQARNPESAAGGSKRPAADLGDSDCEGPALVCGRCSRGFADQGQRQPMMLACGHTICNACTKNPSFPNCPFCRKPCARPLGAIPPNYALMHALVPPSALASVSEGATTGADVATHLLLRRWNLTAAQTLLLHPQQLVLGSALGQGATGLLVRGTLEGQEVAVKTLKLPSACAPAAASRLSALQRELTVLLHVTSTCPHTCRYLGLCLKDNELCLVMPRYPTSLADCNAQAGSGGLQLPRALALSLDMARGLEELHGQGVVAGSLKPHNVLLTAQGAAVLNDFGLGQAISRTHAEAMAMRLAWTYNYLSPEQMEDGGCISSKADVWAWACTLIHMLTGQAPMADLRRMQIIRKLLNSCLEFDPNSRPTAAEVCQALGESHADQAVSPGATALITITMRDLMGGEVLFRLSPLVKLHKLMAAYYVKKRGTDPNSWKFLFNGVRLEGDESAASHGISDGDCIDVVMQQLGDVGQWEDVDDGNAGCAAQSPDQLLLLLGAAAAATELPPDDVDQILRAARSPPPPVPLPPLLGNGNRSGGFELLPGLLSDRHCTALIAHLDAQLRALCAADPAATQVFDGQPAFAPLDFKLLLPRAALDALVPSHASTAMEACGVNLLSRLGITQSQAPLRFILRRRALAPRTTRPQCIPFHRDSSLVVVNVALNSSYEGGALMYLVGGKLMCPRRPVGWGTAHDLTTVHGVSHLSAGVRYNLFAVFDAAGKAA